VTACLAATAESRQIRCSGLTSAKLPAPWANSSPWFADNKNFLTDQAQQFRATGKLAVAGYGLGQGDTIKADKFTPGTTPWLLVSMFCQRTVKPVGNGLPGQNTDWTNEFRTLQRARL